MDAFVLIMLGLVTVFLVMAVAAGIGDRRAATRLARQRERRDLIASGVILESDVKKLHANENDRRRRGGLGALGRRELESMMLADARTRWRLLLWKGRR